ncbi:hypothetical protein E2C01_080822 [Portunus trituberculatus]|uniref:Uncharacterized protein n=1 Tax=Portunus trituberculatus TaxID=210409 RepID=A0A5B7IKM6_PORTR|nr:hypothetical protein [Portunus trituberculatus]
MLCATWMAVT